MELCHTHVVIGCYVTVFCACVQQNGIPSKAIVQLEHFLRLLASCKEAMGWCTSCSV